MTTVRNIAPPAGKDEARKHAREPVFVPAYLRRFSDAHSVCAILQDIHAHGTRIRLLADPGSLEGALELIFGKRRLLAYLVWRKDDEAGLGFLADLSSLNTRELEIIRLKVSSAM